MTSMVPGLLQAVVCSTLRSPLWCAVAGLVIAEAQPGGRDEQGEGPQGMTLPQWLVAVARTMRLLQDHGMSGPDILGLLSAVAQERGDPRYQTFSNTVIDIIRAIASVPHVGAHPGVPEREAVELVEFADRRTLAEYLATYHETEVILHEALLERGLAPADPLPPVRGEGPEQASNRERYNQVRRAPPLLQQLLASPPPPADSRGHRLTWTGEVVQQTYDYYTQGFHTGAVGPLLRHCVAERRFAEYEAGAALYVADALDQLDDYVGPLSHSPEGLARWAAEMERQLWEAFVLHGLDLRVAQEGRGEPKAAKQATGA